MLRRLLPWIAACAVVLSVPVTAGSHAPHRYHHLCTLVALPWDVHTRVPAADGPAVAPDGGATFQVTYTGFTSQAQAAFQRAVDLWAGLVSSPVPIRISAEFASLGTGVLGSAGATCYFSNFSGAPVSNTWFPNPLADRLAGTDITSTSSACPGAASFEIDASFSSTANWYYGTDGATPSGRYDFVSVVLHEIGHGLGFLGFGDVSGGLGTVVSGGRPGVFDRFTVSETGVSLLTGFTQSSTALATQLTHNYSSASPRGPGVYFNGTNANAANAGLAPRLYTVSPWNAGSSYSHLDDSTYPAGHPDSLMTHAINSAESIHHPGNVTLGIFKDMGWSTCPASLSSTSATVGGAASSGSVTLSIDPGCVWTATSASSFLTITGSSSGTGAGTITFAVAANTTGSTRQGTLRVSGVTFTVTQNTNTNTVSVSPSTLRFAGTNTGGTLSPLTAAQRVTVTTAGTGTIAWTATASQPWLQVSPSSGTGAGVFSVSIVNPGNVLGTSAGGTATVTIASPNAGNTATVTVHLTLGASASFAGPIGQVDTPTQNATGAQGAIAMTGWAVDDVGIQHVRIYRQCLAFDVAGACQTVLGASVVFVGEASIIAGARPDVEALFSTYPAANTAGWGFLTLSNLLPNIPALNPSGGGVGTFQLYAVATDAEGRQRLLGRSYVDTAPLPTSVTVANDTIAKPFGAIDTPGQGATVSGTLNNFGWVLTPDSNTVADGTDILVPTAGATIQVFVDGAAVGAATFNLCRGTVGNPVPSATLCDDDVSSIFRSGNRYRNLDAGRGAIGLRSINTASLTNGLHTIQWGVTDSAGRSEGIGSRYFTVLNGAGDAPRWRDDEMTGWRDAGTAALRHLGTSAPRHSGTPVPRLFARTGFDLARGFTPVEAIDDVPTIRVPELGRVELQVPGVTAGALLANGELRDLPVGMSINTETGTVAWSVGPGYLGTYRLALGVDDGTSALRHLDVVVVPEALGDEPVRMFVDRADIGGPALSERLVRVEGWALDPKAETGSGIGAVHVWGKRSAGVLQFLGVAEMGIERPDVAAAHGGQFGRAGWRFLGRVPESGTWEVTTYVWNSRTGRFEDARTVSVTVR